MRRFSMFMFLFMTFVSVRAQFVNNGATVTIQAGATLRVETDFTNTSGTITNNGTLEVQGNFNNDVTNGVLTPSTGLVRFIGTTNSTLNTGGDALNNVEMAKTANATVTLTAPASIGGNLNFTGTGSRITLGANNLTLASSSVVSTPGANGYVVTDGAGKLIKGLTGSSTILLEVGDATNYTPVSSVISGGPYVSASLSGRVYTSGLQAKYNGTTDFINREWQVQSAGITGYSNTMTGTYVVGDVTGTQSLIKGATYHTGDWRFDGSAGSGLTVTALTTNTDVKFSGKNFYGKANLKAYLSGALLSGSTMTTALNSILPLSSPYSAAPFNAPSVTATTIPALATDWILVEVRDAVTPSTVVSQTSGFLMNDGSIVGFDGAPLRLKNAVTTGHIALKHRNHLSVRTNNPIDLVNPPTLQDFSNPDIVNNNVYINGAISNSNMKTVGSWLAMWNGDINQDGLVKYNLSSNDRALILTAIGGVNPNSTISGYRSEDINMDGVVKYNLSSNDRAIILTNIGGTNPNATLTRHL